MRILITDGDNRASLAITRSLGKKNHILFVGQVGDNSLAASSKYCENKINYPDPEKKPDEFIDYILNFIEKNNINMVIPVADITTFLLTSQQNEKFNDYIIPYPDLDTVLKAADKLEITKLSDQLNIPVPKTVYLKELSEIDKIRNNLNFPVVIKPSRSRIKIDNYWHYTAVSYAESIEELVDCLQSKPIQEFPVLLQERIIGPGIGIFMCCSHGEPVAYFSHKRLREKPPSGGVSVLRESIEPHPLAKEYASKILKELKWHGIAMVEFKLDNKDSTPKLIEINGRFWGSLQLAIDSGVDFPDILIKLYTQDENPASPPGYKTGVQTRWLWGDIDSLLLLLLKNNKSLKLPENHDSRLMTLLKFCKFWGKNLNYEVLKLDDIRPWFYETRKWFGLSKK